MKQAVKVWGILSGPISIEDSENYKEFPDDCRQLLICRAEVDGELETIHYWFENEEDANEWVKHFNVSIEPLEINYWDKYDA